MATLIDHLMLWGAFFLTGFAIGLFFAYTLGSASKKKL